MSGLGIERWSSHVPNARGAAVVLGPGRLLGWFSSPNQAGDLWFGAFLSFPAAGPRAAAFVDRQRKKKTKRRLGGCRALRGAGTLIARRVADCPSKRPRRAPQVWTRKPPARPAASTRGRDRDMGGAEEERWPVRVGRAACLVAFPRWIRAVPRARGCVCSRCLPRAGGQ